MEKVKKLPLGQVARLERKAADLKVHFDHPYISLEDIDSETGAVNMVEREKPKSSKFLFSDKHVLYGKLRPYLRKVARPAFKGICSTDIIPILPAPELNRDYLYHFLRTSNFTALATKLAVGVNLPRLNPKQLSTFEIPLPTFDSQKRIAKILDAADALRAKRRESLTLLDNLIQSTFLDMFGDPVMNPMGWETHTLKEIGEVKTGSTPSSKLKDMFDGEIPFVTPGDLCDTWTDALRTVTNTGAENSKTVERGATLVCCIGATIGKMGKAAKLSAFNQQINAVTWGFQIENNFGLEMMKFFKKKIAKSGASTTLPILKKTLFEKIIVTVPPLPLQQRFASIVEAIEKQKARLKAHLAELDTLFASLQSRAFKGEL